MQKKKVLVYLLTVVLFLSAVFVGVTAVFRVRDVTLEVSAVSSEAIGEAESIENKIKEKYVRESMFSLDEKYVLEILTDFPYFRLTGFKKSYPNLLTVSLAEDSEAFALFDGTDNYDILSADGTFLSKRDHAENRSDGKDNVVVSGAYSDPERSAVLAFLVPLGKSLGGIRTNVKTVETQSPVSDKSIVIVTLTMREGVSVVLLNAIGDGNAYAAAFSEFYSKMSTEERTKGIVHIQPSGKITYEP